MKAEQAVANPVDPVVVEKDVDVPMRDGARLKADVFRPYDEGKFPAILNLGPYQKDKPAARTPCITTPTTIAAPTRSTPAATGPPTCCCR